MSKIENELSKKYDPETYKMAKMRVDVCAELLADLVVAGVVADDSWTCSRIADYVAAKEAFEVQRRYLREKVAFNNARQEEEKEEQVKAQLSDVPSGGGVNELVGSVHSEDVLEKLTQLTDGRDEAGSELVAGVARARQLGHSWADIGKSLRVTRQAAHARFQAHTFPG